MRTYLSYVISVVSQSTFTFTFKDQQAIYQVKISLN